MGVEMGRYGPLPYPSPTPFKPLQRSPNPTPDQAPLAGSDTYCRILRFADIQMMRALLGNGQG